MEKQPKYRVEIFWSEEDHGYIANIPELKYCSAFGDTREEALHEVLVAEALHLETLAEIGREVPELSTDLPAPEERIVADVSLSSIAGAAIEGNVRNVMLRTDYAGEGVLRLEDFLKRKAVSRIHENKPFAYSHYIESEGQNEAFFQKLLAQG